MKKFSDLGAWASDQFSQWVNKDSESSFLFADSKDCYQYPCLALVQPKKTDPDITEKLLTGR